MRRLSGKYVVLIMFLLGILFAAGMVLYWHFQTKPFISLQQEIKKKYPEFQISISGGREIKAAGKPYKLRVIMHQVDASHNEPALIEVAENILKQGPAHLVMSNFDILEIHLIHTEKENSGKHKSFIKSSSRSCSIHGI